MIFVNASRNVIVRDGCDAPSRFFALIMPILNARHNDSCCESCWIPKVQTITIAHTKPTPHHTRHCKQFFFFSKKNYTKYLHWNWIVGDPHKTFMYLYTIDVEPIWIHKASMYDRHERQCIRQCVIVEKPITCRRRQATVIKQTKNYVNTLYINRCKFKTRSIRQSYTSNELCKNDI